MTETSKGNVLLEFSHEELDKWSMCLALPEDVEELPTVLRVHLAVEQMLHAVVTAQLERPDAVLKRNINFAGVLDIARATGAIPDREYAGIKALNKIRNGYAHDADYRCSLEELSPLKIGWGNKQLEAFGKAKDVGPHKATELAVIFLMWSVTNLVAALKTDTREEED